MKARAILLLFFPLALFAGSPRWAVRVHPAVLAGLEYSDLERGRVSPAEVVDKLKAADFGNQLVSFLELCRRHGISEVILDGVQPELKGIYFHSPVLESAGWVVLADVLAQLRTEAGKRDMKVGLNLSELGIHARGLYEQEYGLEAVRKTPIGGLEPLFQGLRGTYSLASVSEEEFPALWFQPVLDLSRRLGFTYVHRVTADEVVNLTTGSHKTTPIDVFPEALVLSARDVDRVLARGVEAAVTNGSLPLMLSPTAAVEVSDLHQGRLFLEGGVLFRALQTAPLAFTLEASRETLTRLTPGLFSRAEDLTEQHDASAPLLNLVVLGSPRATLDAGQVAWLQLAANLEPLSLAFGAAGFRVRMTDRVLPDAHAYYVYLAGDAREPWSKCEAVLRQRDRDVPVFVQLGSEPLKPLLDELGRFLGFRSASWVKGIIPPVGVYKGRQMSYKGPDLYNGHVPAGYLQLAVDPQQVLMSDASRNALITVSLSAPRRFFVNSNLIHRDVAFPLSHLLTSGRGLQRPAACFIAVGKRTVFWALASGEVEWIHPRNGQRLVLEMKEGGFHVE
ncbi:MAG: hypothetical protein ACE15E_02060 [Acidobacteriota bacterium]